MTRATLLLALILSGAVSTAALWELVRRTPVARAPIWQCVNYRDRVVSLLGGPVVLVAAALGAGALAATRPAGRRRALAVLVVLMVAAAAGVYDDLRGEAGPKGLAGHLRAAARGRLTSGVLKVVALGIGGAAAAALLAGRFSLQAAADGLLIATSANLANLFDLRPGRAAKFTAAGLVLVAAVGSAASTSIAWCAGVSLGILGYDLRERVMLGDAGANALGAALGVGIVAAGSPPARLVALVAVVALTLLSEIVSFGRVIDATPPLRWLDALGRCDGDRRARA